MTTYAEQLDNLTNEVRRLATEKPDFVYESPGPDGCVYVFDGAGSCIVGQAAMNLGLISADFEYGPYNVETGVLDFLPEALGSTDFDHTSNRINWLTQVQVRQDDSWEWLSAVVDADESFPLN